MGLLAGHIARILRETHGATAVEYGFVTAVAALGILCGVDTFGDKNTRVFETVTAAISVDNAGSATTALNAPNREIANENVSVAGAKLSDAAAQAIRYRSEEVDARQVRHSPALINGGLERDASPKIRGVSSKLEGWSSTNGFKSWETGYQNIIPRQGDTYIELDVRGGGHADAIWQQIKTQSGTQYRLSVDVHQRGDMTDSIAIVWNDVIQREFTVAAGAWRTVTLELTGTGGLDRLELREAQAQSNGIGVFLDNIRFDIDAN